MKRFMAILMVAGMVFICMACSKQEEKGDVTSTFPSNHESTTTISEEQTEAPTTSVIETTTDPGIMPNTAGIVVRETTEEETTTYERTDERRGLERVGDNNIHLADEDARRLGVSKILVVQLNSIFTEKLDDEIVSKFNELLVTKYGCDFVVSFMGYDFITEEGYSYYDFLKDIKGLGQQADLIMAVTPAYYPKLVQEDFFVDITDYLKTEEGNRLYEAYPKEIWDTVAIDGRIYGYTPYNMPKAVCTLCCNRKVADKLGINVKEGFSFWDIGDILETAGLSVKDMNGKTMFYMDSSWMIASLGYDITGLGVGVKRDENGEYTAFNVLEEEGFINLCKTIRQYKDRGWLSTSDDAYYKVKSGDFLFSTVIHMYADGVIGNLLLRERVENKRPVTESYEVIQGETYYSSYLPSLDFVYGVTSWSEYKEEALKYMTLINTEAELANLLTYGIENVHYTYRDKRIIKLPTIDFSMYNGRIDYMNPSILYPQYNEPENKVDFYKEMSSKNKASFLIECGMTRLEFAEYADRFENKDILGQIYEQGADKLLKGEYEDVDAAIAEINRMLKEAGIDEVINIFNTELFYTDAE